MPYGRETLLAEFPSLTMTQPALTPVERGLLILLMTSGRPLKNTEVKKEHGLQIKPAHRDTLKRLGLITVLGPPFIYALTPQGWEWLSKEAHTERPKGVQGATHDLVAALERLAGRHSSTLKDALHPDAAVSPAPPAGGEVAWSDADEPLARALQDITVFTTVFARLKEAGHPALDKEIRRAENSANLVFQSLRLAAAKRKLKLDGQIGSEVSFDPVLFHSDDLVTVGDPVCIRKSAVTRGEGKAKVIIQPGLVKAVHGE
jgi:hypothetical protein